MSKPMAEPPKQRRPRRRFDEEFKEQAVRLVLDQGKSIGAAARSRSDRIVTPEVGRARSCRSGQGQVRRADDD